MTNLKISNKKIFEVATVEKTMSAVKGLSGSIILLMIFGLLGCAGPTGYTKAPTSFLSGTKGYGYSDKRISIDEFSIVVLGNPSTSKERVAEIGLLRAAHLTKEQGRTHFSIIKQKTVTAENAVMMPIPLFIGGVLVPVPVGERTDKEPMAILLIRVLPSQLANSPDALNAEEIINQLAKNLK